MPRFFKQLIILGVFLALAAGISVTIYLSLRTSPTCTDNVQNQGEEGVDCGVVCGKLCPPAVLSLQVVASQLLPIGSDRYDFVAQVHNPNGLYGSGEVSYSITYQNASGSAVYVDGGSFYILPNQTRYIIKTVQKIDGKPVNARFAIEDVNWQKIDAIAGSAIDFSVRNDQYTGTTDSASYRGILINNSDFDFDTVEVDVILLDQTGRPVGVNSTVLNTLLSGEQRFFAVKWPFAIGIDSPTVIVSAVTNAFENNNFVKRYGAQEKFQEFY